jgi:hypothetical protein
MTHLGGLKRVLDAETEKNSVIDELQDAVYEKIMAYDKRLNRDFDVKINPIKNNVGMMISSIIHSAIYAKNRQP